MSAAATLLLLISSNVSAGMGGSLYVTKIDPKTCVVSVFKRHSKMECVCMKNIKLGDVLMGGTIVDAIMQIGIDQKIHTI